MWNTLTYLTKENKKEKILIFVSVKEKNYSSTKCKQNVQRRAVHTEREVFTQRWLSKERQLSRYAVGGGGVSPIPSS